jgi:hypothetical protein
MSTEIKVPISPGELIDKITILEIKRERLTDPARRVNVDTDLASLVAARDRALRPSARLASLTAELKTVNLALWDVEDEIRRCEQAGDFGSRFIELARAVYHQNDRRSAIKRVMNELVGSARVEEKVYTTSNP